MSIQLKSERYEEIQENANCLFEDLGFTEYPVDPFEVAKRLMIEIKYYSSIPLEDKDFVVSKFEDGYGVKFSGIKYMIYLSDEMPEERIKFTLWLEIGHIQLGHYEQHEKSQALMNAEAKAFAKYCIAALPFVNLLNPSDPVDLQIRFGLSRECSEYIFTSYKNAVFWDSIRKKICDNRITEILNFNCKDAVMT